MAEIYISDPIDTVDGHKLVMELTQESGSGSGVSLPTTSSAPSEATLQISTHRLSYEQLLNFAIEQGLTVVQS